MRRALLVVLLTLGLGLGSGAVVQASEKPSLPEQAADRAREALADAKAALHGKGRDATMALLALSLSKGKLSGRERLEAEALLARPTDGKNDRYGDGYPAGAPVKKLCSTHFCVHYVASSVYTDAPPMTDNNGNTVPDWVEITSQWLENVWNAEVNSEGYRPPATDGTKGGDSRFDVYLSELTNDGLYGYCAGDGGVPGYPRRASGYCVLDDDFVGYPIKDPVANLKVTAAHEFFHAIQFNYDVGEDSWIMESTATWMEEQVFTEVNDNRYYLQHGQLGRPAVPLDIFEDQGLAQYGNWIFFERMEKDFGASAIKALWQQMDSTSSNGGQRSVDAIRSYVASRGTSLPVYYRAFAAGNIVPMRTYPEGSAPSYKEAPKAGKAVLKASSRSFSAQPQIARLSSMSYDLWTDSSLGTKYRYLRLNLDLPLAGYGPGAFAILHNTNGTKTYKPIALNSAGDAIVTVGFADASVNRVTLVLSSGATTGIPRYYKFTATAVA